MQFGLGNRTLAYLEDQDLRIAKLPALVGAKVDLAKLGDAAPKQLLDVAVSSKDTHVALAYESAAGRTYVALLRSEDRSVVRHFSADAGRVAFADSGQLLLTLGKRETASWNVATGKRLQNLEGPRGFMGHAAAQEAALAVLLVRGAPGKERSTPGGGREHIVNPGSPLVWNPRTGQHHPLKAEHYAFAGLSADGRRALLGWYRSGFRLLEARKGKVVFESKQPAAARGAFAPDGSRAALALDSTIRVVAVQTAKEVQRIDAPGIVRQPRFTADSRQLCFIAQQRLHCAATPKKP